METDAVDLTSVLARTRTTVDASRRVVLYYRITDSVLPAGGAALLSMLLTSRAEGRPGLMPTYL